MCGLQAWSQLETVVFTCGEKLRAMAKKSADAMVRLSVYHCGRQFNDAWYVSFRVSPQLMQCESCWTVWRIPRGYLMFELLFPFPGAHMDVTATNLARPTWPRG